jgi:predicted DNA-binding protein (UPF0278 family)
MKNMGPHFRAPRKADATQWKKVEMLHQAGAFSHPIRYQLGKFPDTILETKAFIEKNRSILQKGRRIKEDMLREHVEFMKKARAIMELEKKEKKRVYLMPE